MTFGTSTTRDLKLLIEPDGIEIESPPAITLGKEMLLIEPYGIEIRQSLHYGESALSLLIEPYGIEIWWYGFCC